MLELAVQGQDDGLEVSDVELRRSGPSYTVDTLRELRREWPGHQLWFLIGSDALADLASWHEPDALLSLASFAVVPRGGARTRVCLSDLLPERFHAAYERDAKGWRHRSGEELRALDFEPSEHSSSEIRARLRKGEPVTPWVSPAVLAYIRKHDLYQEVE